MTVREYRIFAGVPDQVAHARVFARQVLGPFPLLDETLILLSELCANALLHTGSGGGGTFEVAIYPGPGKLRVEVRDGGSRCEPALVPADQANETGRGLQLVAAIAESWGFSGDRNGRVVYFELPLPATARWVTYDR